MKRRYTKGLAIGLAAAALAAAPAQAVPDERGGAVSSSPTPQIRVDRFDWSDAGVGGGVAAAAALIAAGAALAVRRYRADVRDVSRPAAP